MLLDLFTTFHPFTAGTAIAKCTFMKKDRRKLSELHYKCGNAQAVMQNLKKRWAVV